jgi:hypothetical protein
MPAGIPIQVRLPDDELSALDRYDELTPPHVESQAWEKAS